MFFEENKLYRFKNTESITEFKYMTSINEHIADFIIDRGGSFMVKLDDNDNVDKISVDGVNWISRVQAIPDYSGSTHGKFWFYAAVDEEFECFEEVKSEEDEVADYIVLIITPEESWFIGGNDPVRFTLTNAKARAENSVRQNPNAEVQIFHLETTAEAVTTIKFS